MPTDAGNRPVRFGGRATDTRRPYPSSLVSRADQTIDTEQIAEQWDRMGHSTPRLRPATSRRHPARLLKVEQLHALARRLLRATRPIKARELWEQMNTCSCLNPDPGVHRLLAGVRNLRVLSECDPAANGIDLSLLEHVSPIEWDNVVLYGQYILDRKLVRQRRRAKTVGLSV